MSEETKTQPEGEGMKRVSSTENLSVSGWDDASEKIISRIKEASKNNKVYFSFEYFPPKTQKGVFNLFPRIERMSQLQPMFMDVTWGAGGGTADLTLDISSRANLISGNTQIMMHLTCTNMPEKKLSETLAACKSSGIRNILALRGDPPRGQDSWEQCEGGFSHAVDLVRYIREKYGDYFGIGVAGYPEGHTESKSMQEDMKYLKEKVDAGADFIITQLFYNVDTFLKWVSDCRDMGIECPIIPGIMPIQNYNGFKRMTGFCQTDVPQTILDALEPIKDDDAAVKRYGIKLAVEMCTKLLEAGIQGLHFYTLNLERSVTRILQKLGFIKTKKKADSLPWQTTLVKKREKEAVRPIFWANRPTSYCLRTAKWDDFPNGRWGNTESPAFGDLSDYHLAAFKAHSKKERLEMWGTPQEEKDVFSLFARFLKGEVGSLPWCEDGIKPETARILGPLQALCQQGFLLINSQPRVNAAPSTDDSVGWGGPGGYVYQKAYLEFFCSPELLEKLTAVIKKLNDAAAGVDSEKKGKGKGKAKGKVPPRISFMATNAGDQVKTNCSPPKSLDDEPTSTTVNAVTWGVFPNKEIQQPTIVSFEAFQAWKSEAFALWGAQWGCLYQAGSASRELIERIASSYFLVNIVDNDFVRGNIFDVFTAAGVEVPSE